MPKNELIPISQMKEQDIIDAINKDSWFIDKVEKTPERCMAAVKQNGNALKCIPQRIHTVELCLEAVKNDGNSLRYVHKKILTYEICLEAVKNNGIALLYVPDNIKNKDLCKKAVKQNGEALKYVPSKYINSDLCIDAVNSNGMALSYIPEKLLTKEHCLNAIKKTGRALEHVPSKLKTKILCTEAIRNDGQALEYVPNRFRTQELCSESINTNWMSLKYIPEDMRSYELCLLAIKQNGQALQYVPDNICTIDLCLEALKQHEESSIYIPNRLKRKKAIIIAERQCGIRKSIKKKYSKETRKFYVEEKIKYDFEEKEFNSFDKFYNYLEGDLTDSDLFEYDFENIDLSHFNIDGAGISNSVLREQGLYDDSFYAENIRNYFNCSEIEKFSENEVIEANLILHSEDFDNVLNEKLARIYYISDIHLNHKIHDRFPEYATKWEVISFIRTIVEKMVNTIGARLYFDYLLVAGDVSFSFETTKIFYEELTKKWDSRKIIVVLGNHELWNFNNSHPIKDICSVEEIINKYRDLFENLKINFLQNDLLIFKDHEVKIVNEEQLENIDTTTLREFCINSPLMILGSLGYSGYSKNFNATHGIYRQTITSLVEDIKQTEKFENIYTKVDVALNISHVIVLTHTPKDNWTKRQYNSKWIYVNGHTHHNDYVCNDKVTIYSDNQIGYYSNSIGLKHFLISRSYDVFMYYIDGIYEITREQYLDFNRGLMINMTFNRTKCSIYMLKNSGLYCFILKNDNSNRLYILNGGSIEKLNYVDINYYFNNLLNFSNCVKELLKDYNAFVEMISQSVKAFGGIGTIHGCIVDIDYFNHIYINPNDYKVTPYYATSIVNKYVYKDVSSLLIEHRKDLYKNYLKCSEGNQLLKANDKNNESKEESLLIEDTGIYYESRIIKKIQYLINDNVVRIWNDQLIDAMPCIGSQGEVTYLKEYRMNMLNQ